MDKYPAKIIPNKLINTVYKYPIYYDPATIITKNTLENQ